jgi:shikimate kinase
MPVHKNIFLLIGPKGCGKSFIGMIFDRHFHVHFVRVEDAVKKIRRDRDMADEAYICEAFETIESAVRQSLESYNSVVFESTGLSDHFDNMLQNLKTDFHVTTINVNAEKELCLERVGTRDRSVHINVSDKEVNTINTAVIAKNFKADFEIENSDKPEKELIKEIRKIILGVGILETINNNT